MSEPYSFDHAIQDASNDRFIASKGKTLVSLVILGSVSLLLGVVGIVVFFVFPILGCVVLAPAVLGLIACPFVLAGVMDKSPKLVLCRHGFFDNTDGKRMYWRWDQVSQVSLKIEDNKPLPSNHIMVVSVTGADAVPSDVLIYLDLIEVPPQTVMGRVEERLALSKAVTS